MKYPEIPLYECILKRNKSIKTGHGVIKINSPRVIANVAKKLTDNSPDEKFLCFSLDNALNIIGVNVVTTGTQGYMAISPTTVFRCAMLLNATNIITVHNHPSGNILPSTDDITAHNALKKAGVVLGIHLLDSIIVTYNTKEFHSMEGM